MKTRQGFVSNSSSTSFIVALKSDAKPCPHCGRKDPNFLDLVEHLGNINPDDYETTKIRQRGVDNIKEKNPDFDSDWYGDEHRSTLIESLEVGRLAEKKGMEVAFIEISYHDESTGNTFRDLVDRGSIVVIWSDHTGNNNVKARKEIEKL